MSSSVVSLVCPKCRQLDGIRKVSAIISQDTIHSTTVTNASGLIVGASGLSAGSGTAVSENRTQSVLCKRLALPPQPKASSIPTWFYVSAVFTCLVFVGSIINLAKQETQAQALGGIFLLTPLFAWLSYWLWRKKPVAEEQNKATEARWLAVKSVWEQAYYCGRCDGVFKPGDSEVRMPEHAWVIKM